MRRNVVGRLALALLLPPALLARPTWADDATAPTAAPAAAPVSVAARTYLVGEFALDGDVVVDGDTLRLGQVGSVRVLGLDCEEVFVHGAVANRRERTDEARAREDFAAYAKEKRGWSALPVKYGTPAGVEAQRFARAWFQGVTRVRLERDELGDGRARDGYGRTLGHVFAEKGGKDVLFAEAVVRAGLSPYFTKYGRSKRFDARLRAAQDEARAAGRGIWGQDLPHYPDYGERAVWWEERAKQVDAWQALRAKEPARRDLVELGAGESDSLADRVGTRVTVFGSLDHFVDGIARDPDGHPLPEARDPSSPRILFLVDRPRVPLAIVVWSDDVWSHLDLVAIRRRFVRATGTLQRFRDRIELRLESASDLSTP